MPQTSSTMKADVIEFLAVPFMNSSLSFGYPTNTITLCSSFLLGWSTLVLVVLLPVVPLSLHGIICHLRW